MRYLNSLRFFSLVLASVPACMQSTDGVDASTVARGVEPPRSVASLEVDSSAVVTTLWNTKENRLRRVSGDFAVVQAQTDLEAAEVFLRRHAEPFGLRQDGADLKLVTTRMGLLGTYVRFDQFANLVGSSEFVPVFDGEVIVLVSNSLGRRAVRSVEIATRHVRSVRAPLVDIGASKALALARTHLGAPVEDAAPQVLRGIGGESPRVAYRVRITAETPAAWEVLVDAATGDILSAKDRIKHVNGTALVYDPNPLASTGVFTFVDGGNATTPALDAARFAVTLPNLDGSGFTRGSWVDAHTKNINQRANSPSLMFAYTRAQSGFEQANAYYHLDRTQTRIQALGILNANARRQEIISDGQQTDNSFYDPAKLIINYGQGGVDDAEDADVVVHEYGHAVQDDQVPNYGAGPESGAMGEGFGDYLAATMGRFGGHKIDDPYCIAEWDATAYAQGNPPCLRRLDTAKHYPEHFVGEVHDDGEMWSAAVNALDMTLGPDIMMRLVIEGHFSHSTTETFFGATQAILDADNMLYNNLHEPALRRRFIWQGLSRILSMPSPLSTLLMQIPVSIDNPRTGGLYANTFDDTQTYTYPGAQALRVHFATIDTETDPTCLDNGCDNIYLTDGNGDLFQIIFGTQSNVSSVVIPGDTVNIRLVTDANTQKMGYHVDRIDILGDGGSSSSSSSSASSSSSGAGSSSSSASSSSSSASSSSSGASSSSSGASSSSSGASSSSSGASSSSSGASSSSSGASSSSSGAGSSSGDGGMGGHGGAGGNGGHGGTGGLGGSGGNSSPSGSSSSGMGGGGETSSSSSGAPRPSPEDDGSCGCRMVGDSSPNHSVLSFVSAIALSAALKRRRKPTRS